MNLNKQILALLIILIANSATILAMDAGDAPEDMGGKINNFDASSKKITKERRKKCFFSIRDLMAKGDDKIANSYANALRWAINSQSTKISTPITDEIQRRLNTELFQKIDDSFVGTSEIKALIDCGAQVDAKDGINDSPLSRAALHGYEFKCRLLIDYGAQINTQDNFGYTALMLAARQGYDSICELLIDHHAKIDTQTHDGHTALLLTAYNGYDSICKFLLNNGARVDAKNHNGITALKIAASNNYASTIRALIIHPMFSPFLSQEEFQESRQRIWAALCIFNRACPLLPKDLRKYILCSLPELKDDVINSGAFGLTEKQTPFAPLPLVRFLIEQGKLDPEETVAAIRDHHLLHISPQMFVAIPYAQSPAIRALLHPDNLEQNFAAAVELNIRERLELPITGTEKRTNLIQNSCSVQ